jgi:CubicO group peptidase (beta-lactamase class C family)
MYSIADVLVLGNDLREEIMFDLSKPEDLGFSPERLGRVNDFMERYVNDGKVAGFVTLIARQGKVLYFDKHGYQDVEAKTPMSLDTIFRIYSMTKPITSVALMMLFEKGLVRLEDPVSKFIPEFSNIQVLGSDGKLESLKEEITVHMLLTHTAGLSYAEEELPLIAKYYLELDIWDHESTLEQFVQRIVALPHLHQPGEKWHYSMATDVVGRLIEIIAGVSLAEFFEEQIFKPLGMEDTAFSVPPEKHDRFAELYGPKGGNPLAVIDEKTGGVFSDPKLYCGGQGLVSTARDYFKFAQMLLNKGEFDGVRFLGPRTVEYMTRNHLRPELLPWVMDVPWPGMGFGLGFSVVMDPAQAETMSSAGTIGWGGAASTNFWIDPAEEIIGILLLQLWPSYTYPTTNDFRTAVYQALIESGAK